MGAFLTVDRRAEMFGAPVTIADLAVHSFPAHCGDFVNIYQVWAVLEQDWPFELDRAASEMEYTVGVSARFRDGSTLHISAWAGCCDGAGCRHCRG